MADMSHEEAISTFQSVTGADAPTAEHVLEAHAWDLTRGINFFLEGGASIPAQAYEPRTNGEMQDYEDHEQIAEDQAMRYNSSSPRPTKPSRVRAPVSAARSGRSSRRTAAIRDDDDDEDEDYEPPASPQTRGASHEAIQDERQRRRPREVQEAAKTSTRQSQRLSQSSAVDLSSDSSTDNDDDDDDIAVVEDSAPPHPRQRGELSSHQIIDDDDDDLEISNGNGNRVFNTTANGLSSRNGVNGALTHAFGPSEFPFLAPGLPALGASNFVNARSTTRGTDFDSEMIPAGIDVEEAKMLEAAMMGVPYEGRLPNFGAEAQRPAVPEDPNVIQERLLREEQDQAYQDSLLADIEKKSLAEAEERAKEEQRLEGVREKEAAEQAQRDYESDIEHKLLNLPEEPATGTEGAITVMIRTPQGARFGRRFLLDHTVRDLFWFADVNAAPNFKPGTYHLVTQFPRKVLNAKSQDTLAEAGLTQKQEALFLEAM